MKLKAVGGSDVELGGVATSVIRAQNTALLLRMLWRERQLTRVEIAKRSGLSHSTVSAIVAELERAGLVQSLGSLASRGGRRPQLIGFRDDCFALIGIEIGARHVSAVLTDMRGRVLGFEEQRHPVRSDPEGTLATVGSLIDAALTRERLPLRKVIGIGVAVPSPVDTVRPGELSELIFPAWRGIDVRSLLGARYGIPVFVDNDANLGALAEHWWGAGAGLSELTYVKVGAGVGAGHIIRGELYRGATGNAGEIGHVPIDPDGPVCVCGNRGCLTMYIGSQELSERARVMFGLTEPPPLAEIVRRARAGDLTARSLVDDVGERLGRVLGTLLNLLDVELVVIGGEISTVGDMLLDALRQAVRQRALPSAVAQTRIVTSNLGPRAIAVGAATLVFASALANQQLFPATARGLT
jgi:predicted NBD/HSP70 family sugar kinase